MASSPFTKLQLLVTEWKHHNAISLPAVYAPANVLESPSNFPASLAKDYLLPSQVSEAVESKLSELTSGSGKMVLLRDIGYICCSTENIAYLCKKDAPVLQPFEIRVESDIRFITTVYYDWLTPGETTRGEVFLAIVTDQEMHCYEARSIEHDEVDFLPSFSVNCVGDVPVNCVASSRMKRVFCGNEKGDVYELRVEVKGRQPVWHRVHTGDNGTLGVTSLCVDETKGLFYALYDGSAIDVFMFRQGEAARRITGYRPDNQVSFVDLFPMTGTDPDMAHLVGVTLHGSLCNFELDLRQTRGAFSFVKKLLRTAPASPVSLNLTHQTSSIAMRLDASGSAEQKILGAGMFEGLVLAVTQGEEMHRAVELYSVTRLPAGDDDVPTEPANIALFKEPLRLDGQFVSMQAAADDDTSHLFEGLELGFDELSHQVFIKGRKFVLLTGTRILDVRKRCPVEILMEILQLQNSEHLDHFFRLYGPLETATMAVQLAASRGDDYSRRLLLDDTRLSAVVFSTEGNTSGELSIPGRAILNYFRRLVSPLWKKPLFCLRADSPWKKDSVKLESVLSTQQLDWFINSLEELERFILSYVEEFQAVQFFDGTVFVPKCPSIISEFELLYELKDVIVKSREILSLVKLFKEDKPVHLTDHQMKMLEKTTFEALAFVSETPKSPLQELIAALLADKEHEVQEAIVFRMDTDLPKLSNTKDRIFQKVLSLLKKAKISPRAERQDILVRKAMHLLGSNSEEVHIDAIVNALTELQRHYEILQFVSKTAKKLVPEPPTSDADVQKKAHFLRRRCYDRVFNYVSDYIQNIDTDDDESTDIPILFGAVQCLDDHIMMEMMMEKLLTANKVPRRLMHQPSFFEFGNELRIYLSKKLMNVASLQDITEYEGVSLTEPAEREMRLLVEICQSQGDLRQAGDWLMILAKRSAQKRKKIPLIERIGDLNDARAMYETVMPHDFVRNIEKEIEVAMFQQRVLTMGKRIFAIMDDVMDNGKVVKDVLTKLADVDTLYKVIKDSFPTKIAQDLTIELHRILGEHQDHRIVDDMLIES